MDKEKNMLLLVKQYKEENEILRNNIKELIEINESLKEDLGDNWIHSKIYKDAIKEAKEMKDKYDEAYREMIKITSEYKQKMKELINKY